jgi:hypothetical protein
MCHARQVRSRKYEEKRLFLSLWEDFFFSEYWIKTQRLINFLIGQKLELAKKNKVISCTQCGLFLSAWDYVTKKDIPALFKSR